VKSKWSWGCFVFPEKQTRKIIETENIYENVSNLLEKTHLKILDHKDIMDKKRYNEEFIELTDKLSNIMLKQGEPFRARAYQKAQETIMTYPDDIYSSIQLKNLPNIGNTIMDKLNEYEKTGSLRILEREKTNPINILGDIYGVGPKKAKELVSKGINTIDDLRERQTELLNDIQRVGLKYYEQIQERIPRSEIMYKPHVEKKI
jgi:DNA polymerase/3'-5' exonuclease PolX